MPKIIIHCYKKCGGDNSPKSVYTFIYIFSKMSTKFILHSIFSSELTFENLHAQNYHALLQEVCCSALQCAAVCCIVLQCVAVCCSVLQCVAVCFSVFQCAAVFCSVLQCVAVCCSVLQYVAACCSVLQCGTVCCSVLQCVAVCCSVLNFPLCIWEPKCIMHCH